MARVFQTLNTTNFVWYSAGLGNPATEVSSWIHDHLVTWLGDMCNPTLDNATLVGGSGYTDGTYNDVELVRTATQVNGRDLLCTVDIASGVVTSVTITQKGNGFRDGDTLEFKDISQVGGTGAGFSIDIDTADDSLMIMRDPDENTYRSWMLGVHRTGQDISTYGIKFADRSSQTSNNLYIAAFYDWSDDSASSGRGTHSDSTSTYTSFWDNNDDDGQYPISVAYSSDPDDYWFVIADNNRENCMYMCRAVRDPSATYASYSFISDWGIGTAATSAAIATVANSSTSQDYSGGRTFYTVLSPSDPNAFFTQHGMYGRSMVVGSMPPGIASHSNANMSVGDTKTNGTEVWTGMCPSLWFRTTV